MTLASTTRQLVAFVRLGRLKFLAGGFVLYGIGAAMATRSPDHALDVRAYAWGQAAITATQLMTHYANDYFDLAADRANTTPTRWSGGSRVLADGSLSPRVALVAASALGVLALILDVIVGAVILRDARALAVLVAAVVMAWSYSAPPLRLHTRGLGAPTVALVVGVLTPLAGWLVQRGHGSASFFAVVAVIAPLATAIAAMILVIDFPDAAGDRAAGKRTPVVRVGPRAAARVAALLVVLSYAPLALYSWTEVPRAIGYVIAATIPLGAWLVARLLRGDGERPAAWEGLVRTGVSWLASMAALVLASTVASVIAK
jgi:1,4-dihydroxy-2-naphthoate octaprenyltransferase